jgi:hypothetical protein
MAAVSGDEEMIRFTLAAVCAIAAVQASASTFTYNLSAYTDNSGNTAGIASRAVLSATDTVLTISLSNNSSQGFVTAFYLELGSASQGLGAATINNGVGTAFSVGADPSVPKGGIKHTAGGAWSGNFFSMSADSPSPHNGLNVGETMSVSFAIIENGGFSFANLIAALDSQEVRMAQHYQGWLNGKSEWLLNGTGTSGNNDPNVVLAPLPPAAWAGLGTLGLMAGVRASRRAKN